jgi:hypothetical protein
MMLIIFKIQRFADANFGARQVWNEPNLVAILLRPFCFWLRPTPNLSVGWLPIFFETIFDLDLLLIETDSG